MPPSNIVTAADYADAMMIARRAKNWLFLILLLMLLVQIGLFFTARYTDYVIRDPSAPAAAPVTAPATAPSTQPSADSQDRRKVLAEVLRYVTGGINFMGIVLVAVLALDLLLIVNIMLVGRLVGVAQVTSAWVWCILLALLLFPWQAFLMASEWKFPGILYTWSELINPTTGARFKTGEGGLRVDAAALRWIRFVVFPVISVILLLIVQARSSRGLRAALGESELESMGEIQTP